MQENKTTVVNKKRNEPYDIYIGRGSKFGNPFRIGIDGSREEVIKEYKKHLWNMVNSQKITIEEVAELYGKRLGCFCKPKACHGDVLVKAAEWAHLKLKETNKPKKNIRKNRP